MVVKQERFRIIAFDDSFGKLNSHWPHSTEKLEILERVFYDEDDFIRKAFLAITTNSPEILAFSGKGAANAAHKLDMHFKSLSDQEFIDTYEKMIRVMRVQNTNLSERLTAENYTIEGLKSYTNKWIETALLYPFDVLMMQTFGDAEIINKILGNNSAYWVPYSYDKNKFFPREVEKDLDIGMFFKLERHSDRIPLVRYITEICKTNGWSYCFSDEYWGDKYAEVICRSKILLHFSYFGDIPYRLYEAAGSKICLLTDPLGFGIENMFISGKDYYEYNRDYSDLEANIKYLLENDEIRNNIANSAYENAINNHTWEVISNKYIVPVLKNVYDLKQVSRRD